MLFRVTAAVYLSGVLSYVYQRIHFIQLTQRGDHRVFQAFQATPGGDDMPYGVGKAEIWVPP